MILAHVEVARNTKIVADKTNKTKFHKKLFKEFVFDRNGEALMQ